MADDSLTQTATGSTTTLSIAAHPRAVHGIKRSKSWGGLLGFLLGGYLSLPTHTLADAGFRALAAGVACYVIVWAAAVFLWRGLVVAELRSREHELVQTEIARLQGHSRSPEHTGLSSRAPIAAGRAPTGAAS
jgi:hypothetical protein